MQRYGHISHCAFRAAASSQPALAGGLLLALRLPVRAANEPEQAPDTTAGQFAPNAFIRIDHSGKTTLVMPQVEMGQGVYTAIAMILAEELDADFSQGRARARAAQRQALRQSDFRHPGHRQFQFHPRLLEAAAHGRRGGARDAGAGRRAAMAGRSRKLLGGQQQGHARRERAHARLWRSGRRGERTSGAARSAAQGSEGLHADRQAAQAARHAQQDRRQGHLRHRRDAAGHEVRDARRNARCSAARSRMSTTARPRRSPASGRSSCSTIWSPSSAITCGPPRQGLDALHITWDEGANAQGQFERHLGRSARRQQEGRRRRQIASAISPRAWRRAKVTRPNTNCRSWRMPPWSR